MVRKALFGLSVIAAIALFLYVILNLDGLDQAPAVLAELGWPALLIYFLNSSLTLAVPAAAWTLLMRGEGLKVSYWTALRANLMGGFLNFITPSLFLGGEPLKTYYVAAELIQPKRRVLATIIVAKFQEFGGLLFVMLIATGIALWRIPEIRDKGPVLISSMVALAVLLGLCVAAFLGNFNPTVKILTFLARLGIARRRMARLRHRAREMEETVRDAFTKRWKTFVAAQFITLFSAASILMRAWIFFYFAGELLGTEQLCAVFVITNVANSLPMPGGLGAYEGGMALFGGMVGLPEGGLATMLIVNRAADVFLVLIGLYFIVHLGLQSVAKSVAKGEATASMNGTGESAQAPPPGASGLEGPDQ